MQSSLRWAFLLSGKKFNPPSKGGFFTFWGLVMQPHQQRVVDEKEQLGERLSKLSAFLEKGQPDFIDDAEWQRLINQHMHMNEYHEILIDRINHFVSA